MPIHDVEELAPLVDLLAEFLGRHFEVVLHDFTNPQGSIIRIRNGHVSGRSVGGTVTGMALKVFHEVKGPPNGLIAAPNLSSYTKNGRRLRTASLIIRRRDKNIGALAINLDVTAVGLALNVLKDLSLDPKARDKTHRKEVTFAPDFRSLLDEVVDRTLSNSGRIRETMNRKDRLAVLKALDERGVFLIRGSVREISRRLGISQPTIYKCLAEISGTKAIVESKREGTK
jgi:predicted transcriptional regulator YheO